MKKHLFFVPILFFVNLIFCQNKITIVNEEKEPIPYCNIINSSSKGTFTDELGQFIWEETWDKNKIIISHLLYQTREVEYDEKLEVIVLKKSDQILDEVVVTNKSHQYKKTEKTKAIVHKEFSNIYGTIAGIEIAFLIKPSQNAVLKSISLPMYNKTIDFNTSKIGVKQTLKKYTYQSVFKVEFYENNKGVPGNLIPTEEFYVKINEQAKEIFLVNVEHLHLELNTNGIFVSILNVNSNSDEYIKATNSNYLPQFCVTNKINKVQTFTRNVFAENKNWKSFKGNKRESNTIKNISIGYEILM
jgi:hypothetical protein